MNYLSWQMICLLVVAGIAMIVASAKMIKRISGNHGCKKAKLTLIPLNMGKKIFMEDNEKEVK